MKLETPLIVFLIAFLLAPFTSSIHAISQKMADKLNLMSSKETLAFSPGFPAVGEEPQSAEMVTALEPIAVFEEAAPQLLTSFIVEPLILEEIPIQSTAFEKQNLNSTNFSSATFEPTSSLGRLIVPSINMDVAIDPVGLTSTGNMDVLDKPTRVGWYKEGTVPGNKGSAVIGAHVFQAFAKLEDVKLGSSIYVERKDGSKLRFIVSEIEVYPYTATDPLPKIFNRQDKPRLNLITCDGELTTDGSTYNQRLVVFAELAS